MDSRPVGQESTGTAVVECVVAVGTAVGHTVPGAVQIAHSFGAALGCSYSQRVANVGAVEPLSLL